MAAINGTALLLYSDGVCVAMQKGISITVETDLPDATNKESAGWAQHINGMRNAKIDFTALFSSPASPDMSGKKLMEYITTRTSLLVSVLGLSFPIVAEADLSSLSFEAPLEGAMTLAGSLKVKGMLYALTSLPAGKMVNLITSPGVNGITYDSYSEEGTAITVASNDAGGALVYSNAFAVTSGDVLKLVLFFTKLTGELPSAVLYYPSANQSNVVTLAEGLNILTITATGTVSPYLKIYNTDSASWSTSPIYLFRPA